MSPFNWTVTEPETSQVFNQLQEELKIWQAHNFPNHQSFEPLLGIIEELGELAEAKDKEDLDDAIGDCLVYIADYCNLMNFKLSKISIPTDKRRAALREWSLRIDIGKLCHSHLKLHQKIRMTENHEGSILLALSNILCFLTIEANNILEYNIETCVWQTWLKVRERDWQANRNEAHKI